MASRRNVLSISLLVSIENNFGASCIQVYDRDRAKKKNFSIHEASKNILLFSAFTAPPNKKRKRENERIEGICIRFKPTQWNGVHFSSVKLQFCEKEKFFSRLQHKSNREKCFQRKNIIPWGMHTAKIMIIVQESRIKIKILILTSDHSNKSQEFLIVHTPRPENPCCCSDLQMEAHRSRCSMMSRNIYHLWIRVFWLLKLLFPVSPVERFNLVW